MIKKKANVVVIGGGILGTSIAYNLAKKGCKDVVVLEREYLNSGATGRCGAGIRQQWGTEMNCILSRESVRLFENLNNELEYDHDIEFKQKGYLFVIYSDKEIEQFKKNVALQNSLDIPSRLITPDEAKEIVPHLNTEQLLGATYCPTDGHANPFHVTQAYAKAAEKLGATIHTYTEVLNIEKKAGRVTRVNTNKGSIDCNIVVNAAGGYASNVGEMVGIDLPIYPERHQAMVSEPVNTFQDPMVISLHHHLYIQQAPHGPFIMGQGDPNEPKSYNIEPSWQFALEVSKKVIEVLPALQDIKIVRQWGGLYAMSPDAQPILGESPEVKGFYTAAGFSGHGFMIAPYTAKLMAQDIMGETPEMKIDMLNYDRFEKGELILEPAVV